MPPFFVYGQDRPGSTKLRLELAEEHWAFLDGYSDAMVARGPTLTDDGEAMTGSLHVVDLPDDQAALAFAFEEPYQRAGIFAEVLVHPWRDVLGRTMWQFDGDPESPRFLIIARGAGADPAFAAEYDGRLVVYGELEPIGVAFAVEAAGRPGVEALLAAHRGDFGGVEIHRWRFGGRPAD